MINKIDLKTTRNIFGKHGLKYKGQKVLNNEFYSISYDFYTERFPVVFVEDKTGTYKLFDLEKREFVGTEKKNMILKETKMYGAKKYSDGSQDFYYSGLDVKALILTLNDKQIYISADNVTSKNKIVIVPTDYKRLVNNNNQISGFSFLLAIDENNQAVEIYNNMKRGLTLDEIVNIDTNNSNPYSYLYLKNYDSYNMLSSKNIADVCNTYFDNLAKQDNYKNSYLKLQDLKQERVNCLDAISKNIQDQKPTLEDIAKYKSNWKEYEEKAKLIKELHKQNTSDDLYEAQKQASINENDYRYATNYYREAEKLSEIVESAKLEFEREGESLQSRDESTEQKSDDKIKE